MKVLREFQTDVASQKLMMWHTFFAWDNFDVFDKFKMLLTHELEINLHTRRAQLII